MQRRKWQLVNYLSLQTFIKIGRTTKQVINVLDRHINKSRPMEDVPLCDEKYKVLKENIVVKPLNIIANGVFEENKFSRLPNS